MKQNLFDKLENVSKSTLSCGRFLLEYLRAQDTKVKEDPSVFFGVLISTGLIGSGLILVSSSFKLIFDVLCFLSGTILVSYAYELYKSRGDVTINISDSDKDITQK